MTWTGICSMSGRWDLIVDNTVKQSMQVAFCLHLRNFLLRHRKFITYLLSSLNAHRIMLLLRSQTVKLRLAAYVRHLCAGNRNCGHKAPSALSFIRLCPYFPFKFLLLHKILIMNSPPPLYNQYFANINWILCKIISPVWSRYSTNINWILP